MCKSIHKKAHIILTINKVLDSIIIAKDPRVFIPYFAVLFG